MKTNIHNRFEFQVFDSQTGKLKQKAYAENVILNSFWGFYGTFDEWFSSVALGSGSGTPSVNDTNLFDPITGGIVSFGDNQATVENHGEDNYVLARRVATIGSQELINESITEIGLIVPGFEILITHAMIKDMNGNPIRILKTSTDILLIYVTVYLEWLENGQYNDVTIVPNMAASLFFDQHVPGDFICGLSNSIGTIDYTFNSADVVKTWNSNLMTLTVNLPELDFDDVPIPGGFKYVVVGPAWFEMQESELVAIQIGIGDGSKYAFDFPFSFPILPDEGEIHVYVDDEEYAIAHLNSLPSIRDSFNPIKDYFPFFDSIEKSKSTEERHVYKKVSFRHVVGDIDYCMYNPHYENGMWYLSACMTNGFQTNDYLLIEVSNDLKTWYKILNKSDPDDVDIPIGTPTILELSVGGHYDGATQARRYPIPDTVRNYKYWHIVVDQAMYTIFEGNDDAYYSNGVILGSEPPVGDVVSASFQTKHIPKDNSNVFKFKCDFRMQGNSI